MCTAITYKTKNFYFGRTMDYEFSYGDEITVTPRNYSFGFRHTRSIKRHFAIIGMAHIEEDYPLYYDAVNEKGLYMAGLNFAGNAVYTEKIPGRDNIAQFEIIPWILSQCASVEEAKALLRNISIVNTRFSDKLPPAQLHWIIAAADGAVTVESVKSGIKVYNNTVGVLTNNPSFDIQMFNLNNYMGLSPRQPKNNFSDKINLTHYSRGMGALGLPGDLSSQSRFVRASFVKLNSVSGSSEAESVSQFFHILGAVEQQRGCCELEDGSMETTLYTSCCSAAKGIYYYTTYENHQISAIDMNRENLNTGRLIRYNPIHGEQIKMQN